jgi:alpha-glucosidase
MPLDVMWADIDYMDRWRDFTIASNISWAGLDDFVTDLHKAKKYFVPIMDAGVALVPDPTYEALTEGLAQDIFIKSGNTKAR